MQDYMLGNMGNYLALTYGQAECVGAIAMVKDFIEWPLEKPSAFVTIDDRALTFDGTWPQIDDLKAFQPWNKRPFGATGTFPQGVLNDDDEGALKIGVAFDKKDGLVHINFGKPVAWTAFPPEMAVQLARILLKHAGAKTVEIGF
jgi:hypothetical protein